MKRFTIFSSLTAPLLSVGLLALATTASGEAVPFDQAFEAGWSMSSAWDDGKAEVAQYQATRTQYGNAWTHEETRIVVAEPLRTDQWVKPEWPYEGKPIVPALKYNIVSRFETFNYPYQLMTTLFIDRRQPAKPYKAVFSSQEWCGATFKDLQFWQEAGPRYTADSYWEGQGRIDTQMPWRDHALLEDQLPLSLRALNVEVGDTVRVELVPSQVGNKAIVPDQLQAATITRVEPNEPVEAADTTYSPPQQVIYEVTLTESGGDSGFVGKFVYANEELRPLLHYALRGGHEGTLTSLRRWAYWNW